MFDEIVGGFKCLNNDLADIELSFDRTLEHLELILINLHLNVELWRIYLNCHLTEQLFRYFACFEC